MSGKAFLSTSNVVKPLTRGGIKGKGKEGKGRKGEEGRGATQYLSQVGFQIHTV